MGGETGGEMVARWMDQDGQTWWRDGVMAICARSVYGDLTAAQLLSCCKEGAWRVGVQILVRAVRFTSRQVHNQPQTWPCILQHK